MDPLDDAFSVMRVRESLYARVNARAPWAIRFREGKTARFGLVVAGSCWLITEQPAQSVPLATGDCYVILDGSTYTLGDDPRSPALNCFDVVPKLVDGAVSLGGGGTAATVVTGWFVYDELGARPLTALLPRVLHTRVDGYRTDILKATLELLAKETERPGVGSGVVVSGLADILFVQAIRSHLNNTSENLTIPAKMTSAGSRRCPTSALDSRCARCTANRPRPGRWKNWRRWRACRARPSRRASRQDWAKRRWNI